MKASTFGFDEITAEEVILVGFDGDVLVGDRPRHIEWPIHTEVMLARPNVNAVVHSHPAHCIALGASGQPLLPVSHAACMFVPPDVPRFTTTSELITTTALGADVAATLDDAPAAFLVNHGIVAAGASVENAVIRAVLLEKAAHQQLIAAAFGKVAHSSPDHEALAKRQTVWAEGQLRTLWNYLARHMETVPVARAGAAVPTRNTEEMD
jgi:ribulose-5-phosphate 4-epimerase/fuculose-1-phosphate aldolase